MLLPLIEMLFAAGPEPRFCNLVLANEIFKPSGAAASVIVRRWEEGCGVIRLITIHEIGEIRSSNLNTVLHGHVLQYPINGNAEECRS